MSTTNNKGNCLLFHGGGLCPLSNLYLSTLAEALRKEEIFDSILMGFFSFECLLNPEEFIKTWDGWVKSKAEKAPGGFYGTGRDVDLTNPELQKIAIENCKALGISWIGVAGGDGSCRQVSEISEAFELEGIHLFIPMPLTIDGIEGGFSLGLEPAVRKSVEVLEDLAATNLMTRDNREFSVLCLETQGRNRDDILAHLLAYVTNAEQLGGIYLDDIDLFVVPANYPWNKDKLIKAIKGSTRRTIVLHSEGATNFSVNELQQTVGRKCRATKVGYLSQMNTTISEKDQLAVKLTVESSIEFMKSARNSFSIVFDLNPEAVTRIRVENIDYWGKCNPRRGQKPTMSKDLEKLLKYYTPN